MAKALSELDSQTSSLAQNKINNIIFQAQAGLLTQEMQTQRVIQPQRNYFSQSYNLACQALNHRFMGTMV